MKKPIYHLAKAEKQLAVPARKAMFLLKKNVKNMYKTIKLCYFCLTVIQVQLLFMDPIYGVQKGFKCGKNTLIILKTYIGR